ncbi:MAG: hypothetical protein ACFE96_04060, partial [Candidatus Hermodarchaeota archaeon]
MSIDIIEKEAEVQEGKIEKEDDLDYSAMVISFSDFFHKIEFLDIYTGEENIPFQEMESEYKEL